jgi:hypothetical protein
MGLDVGGYKDHPNWPKMGPSLLITTCLIVAITAKWPPRADASLSEQTLDEEIAFAMQTANRVLMQLITKYESIFPQKKEPWYQANEEDLPK